MKFNEGDILEVTGNIHPKAWDGKSEYHYYPIGSKVRVITPDTMYEPTGQRACVVIGVDGAKSMNGEKYQIIHHSDLKVATIKVEFTKAELLVLRLVAGGTGDNDAFRYTEIDTRYKRDIAEIDDAIFDKLYEACGSIGPVEARNQLSRLLKLSSNKVGDTGIIYEINKKEVTFKFQGEEYPITLSWLKNLLEGSSITQAAVQVDENSSILAQELAFKHGYKWNGCDNKVNHTSDRVLYFDSKHKSIAHSSIKYFKDLHKDQEVKIADFSGWLESSGNKPNSVVSSSGHEESISYKEDRVHISCKVIKKDWIKQIIKEIEDGTTIG